MTITTEDNLKAGMCSSPALPFAPHTLAELT